MFPNLMKTNPIDSKSLMNTKQYKDQNLSNYLKIYQMAENH